MELAAFELHLLLVELVLDDVGPTLRASEARRLLFPLLLVVELVGVDGDALPVVVGFLAAATAREGPWSIASED